MATNIQGLSTNRDEFSMLAAYYPYLALMNRDEQLLALRPKIILVLEDNKNVVEVFMHQTLRPVLKFQHSILIRCIKQAPHFTHLKLKVGKDKKNRDLLKGFLQKNNTLRSQLYGLVIGLFTEPEFDCYTENTSAINKRISEMIITRFLSVMAENIDSSPVED